MRKAAGKGGAPDCVQARTCVRLDFEQPGVEQETPIPTNQYANWGVLFPGWPALFKPARGTNSGAQALMNGQLAKEFDPGSLVIQFTAPQKRVKAFVGEACSFTLHPAMMRAFDASGRLIAQKGPIILAPDVKTPIEIQSSQSDITRVEIEIGASSFEAIDDLEFDQASPPLPPDAVAPKVTITEPKDGATISADDPFVVLAGTVSEDRRLLRDEVRVTIMSEKNSRSFTMPVSGRSPTFSFGPTRAGSLFEGTNTITVYAQDENNLSDSASMRVSYSRPLPPLIGVPPTLIAFSLSEGGRRLTSTIPIFTSGCRVGDPCEDKDADGITDTWENIAMEILNPVAELDEEENWIEDPNNRRNHHVVNFVRVVPFTRHEKRYVLFFYVATWSRDYGRFSFVDHNGDTERTIMAWRVLDDRTIRLSMVYTAAHEGDSNDHSGVWDADIVSCNEMKVPGWFDERLCVLLEFIHVAFGLPPRTSPRPQDIPGFRLKLQSSEDKHATYPSAEVCEEVTLASIPLAPDIGEDCGGGGLHRFQAFNAGEPDRPFTDRLDEHPQLRSIFPGEAIWTDLYGDGKFCGGLARGGDCGGGHLSEKLGLCARSDPKRVCLPEIFRSKL